MKIERLETIDEAADLTADLIIVGGGPAAFAIAKEFRGSKRQVLVLESGGLGQDRLHEALNTVESVGDPGSAAQAEKRKQFHGQGLPYWSAESQGFGVRCRVLGGSTAVWAGKSAAFSDIDYQAREWAPHSGWPFPRATLEPFLDRAAELLNLGPNCYDERFWTLAGAPAPQPPLDPQLLDSFFWQFSRSRTERLDFMRFGREYADLPAPNVRVLINATVVNIRTGAGGTSFSELEVSTLDGKRRRVRGKIAVLAAGAIENARLLLASGRATGHPMGNQNDLVGRFLLDHPSAKIGRFRQQDCAAVSRRFGFFGLNSHGQTHIYLHGLALSPALQKRERLLNCAAYMMEDRAPDDPGGALKRLMTGKSDAPIDDVRFTLTGSGLLAKGLVARMVTGQGLPAALRKGVIEGLTRRFPNMAVREYRDGGLPHKLLGINIDAITEQSPDPDSRITLSQRTDSLGMPLAHIDWRIGDQARQSLVRMGQVLNAEFIRVGLPTPILEPWVAQERPEDGAIIDMAHTAGTTRMGSSPSDGAVDENGRVYGVDNLYVAGASVFPTSGHANLTLMILAMAIRLADHLKSSPAFR